MDSSQVESIVDSVELQSSNNASNTSVNLEVEIPEVLYKGMKEFVSSNSEWDQYNFISSALANFLFQNGCDERAVTEKYLNDLFNSSHH